MCHDQHQHTSWRSHLCSCWTTTLEQSASTHSPTSFNSGQFIRTTKDVFYSYSSRHQRLMTLCFLGTGYKLSYCFTYLLDTRPFFYIQYSLRLRFAMRRLLIHYWPQLLSHPVTTFYQHCNHWWLGVAVTLFVAWTKLLYVQLHH